MEKLIYQVSLKKLTNIDEIMDICRVFYNKTGHKISVKYNGSKGYLTNVEFESEGFQTHASNNRITFELTEQGELIVTDTIIEFYNSSKDGLRIAHLTNEEPKNKDSNKPRIVSPPIAKAAVQPVIPSFQGSFFSTDTPKKREIAEPKFKFIYSSSEKIEYEKVTDIGVSIGTAITSADKIKSLFRAGGLPMDSNLSFHEIYTYTDNDNLVIWTLINEEGNLKASRLKFVEQVDEKEVTSKTETILKTIAGKDTAFLLYSNLGKATENYYKK